MQNYSIRLEAAMTSRGVKRYSTMVLPAWLTALSRYREVAAIPLYVDLILKGTKPADLVKAAIEGRLPRGIGTAPDAWSFCSINRAFEPVSKRTGLCFRETDFCAQRQTRPNGP